MIEINELTKRYGRFTALNELNLHVEEGSVFGFVGQNGAGKSTTFSILATLLTPTSGHAHIDGHDVVQSPNKVRQVIGYMPDFFGVYDQLKADEYLDFYGAMYNLSVSERKAMIPQLLELVNLTHKKDEYVDLLSRGMKQRLCLARALIHDPKVLILDEPASGLDPRARVEMREILKELKSMNKTIIISSHILPELAEMCDSIGVIDQGELKAEGSINDIRQQLNSKRILKVRVIREQEKAMRFFEDQPLTSAVDVEHDTLIFGFQGSLEDQEKLLRDAVASEISVVQFEEAETGLEEIFMEITKEVDLSS
ncbi:ABC transporter ATP-binding protein [Bacillaceae bacterium SIJ1]|uniref:ABC transporter ATP-binding protein n=1 Tax=Litoribacterium kuwaitense TaxID=1398745 RepID=UPI0013ED2A4C|nr:ABC transporter ATP-binding protein [Litoribacterium kuwaitense]NGP44276.1 ABC transporter ATP-binding protein [Litoribacterium kuwaitense]